MNGAEPTCRQIFALYAETAPDDRFARRLRMPTPFFTKDSDFKHSAMAKRKTVDRGWQAPAGAISPAF